MDFREFLSQPLSAIRQWAATHERLIAVNPTLKEGTAEIEGAQKGTLAFLAEGKPGKSMPAVEFADGKITLGPQVLAVFEVR